MATLSLIAVLAVLGGGPGEVWAPPERRVPKDVGKRTLEAVGPAELSDLAPFVRVFVGRVTSQELYSEYRPNKAGAAWVEHVGVTFLVDRSWTEADEGRVAFAFQRVAVHGESPFMVGDWYLVLDRGPERSGHRRLHARHLGKEDDELIASLGPPRHDRSHFLLKRGPDR